MEQVGVHESREVALRVQEIDDHGVRAVVIQPTVRGAGYRLRVNGRILQGDRST